MILLELALQGIRSFPSLTRIALRPGINVGRPTDPLHRRALVDVVYHVLYPDPARGSATSKLADPDAPESRIALTFFGRDKVTYKVVRDAETGAVSLHRFDDEKKKYSLMTRTAQEVAQHLRVQQHLPDEVSYERLFTFTPETMPSLGLRARTRSGKAIANGLEEPVAPSGPGLRTSPPRASTAVRPRASQPLNVSNVFVQADLRSQDLTVPLEHTDDLDHAEMIDERKKLIAKLKAEREYTKRAERAQVELDSLNARKHELMERAELVKELRSQVEQLRVQAAVGQDLRALPPGFGERLHQLEEAQAKYQLDRQKLIDERLDVEAQLHAEPVLELKDDRYFLAGLGFAIVMFALAWVTDKPAIALLNLPCMLVAGGAAFRWIGELEREARTKQRLSSITDREQRLERQYDLDTAALRRLIQKLEVDNPRELMARIDQHQVIEQALRTAENALADQLADPATARAETEVASLNQRIEACEADVLGSNSVVSAETIDRRIVELERELEELERARAARQRRTKAPVVSESKAKRPEDPNRALFDFGGGDIGSDDDEPGYGSGYGTSNNGNQGSGSKASADDDVIPRWAIGGYNGPPGGSGLAGAYDDDVAVSLGPDRSRDLVQAAVDMLQIPVDDLAEKLKKRVGQYLGAFTDDAYQDAAFGPRGEMAVRTKNGESVAFMDVPVEQIDLVDAALRFALVEACVSRFKIPVLFDDPFLGFPGKKRMLLSQMLGYLGNATQVVLFTEREDVSGHIIAW